MKLNKVQVFVLAGSAAAVVTAAALGILTRQPRSVASREIWDVPDTQQTVITGAFAQATPWTFHPQAQVRAGIVPHHNLVSSLIAGWFSGLDDQPSPSTVVIIGPDHHNRGAGYLTTASHDWKTSAGVVRIDRQLVQALQEDHLVVDDPTLIRSEHGVYTAIPYIQHVWPKAKVVTIAIKGDERPDRLATVASRLITLLGPNDLVVATVDFSHYTTAIDALRADEGSLAVIRAGDAAGALKIPVDSPPAISLILMYAKQRSLQYQELAHTTSAQFTGQLDAPSTTSYLSAYFTDAP